MRGRGLLGVAGAIALAGLGAATGLATSRHANGWSCVGAEVTLFNSSNFAAVKNRGAPPGQIGLKRTAGAAPNLPATIGPFQALASAGQNGAPNVNWYAYVPRTPPLGRRRDHRRWVQGQPRRRRRTGHPARRRRRRPAERRKR